MCVSVCVYVCMYLLCASARACLCACVVLLCVCMFICMCTYIYICVYLCIEQVHMRVFLICVNVIQSKIELKDLQFLGNIIFTYHLNILMSFHSSSIKFLKISKIIFMEQSHYCWVFIFPCAFGTCNRQLYVPLEF